MITPDQAHTQVLDRCHVLTPTVIPIDESLGYVLARDVKTTIPLPVFDNSAMDGFALRARDTTGASGSAPARLEIKKDIYAGDGELRSIARGQTCRIMTGAPVPAGADTILPVELAVVERDTLVIGQPIEKDQHIRRRGEETVKGTTIARRGTVIHPGVIGCLTAVGVDKVSVIRRPRVAIITTGDETVDPGGKLGAGQIYDSNSHMITAMLRQMGIEPIRVRRVKDRRSALSSSIGAALKQCDVLVVLGGVSMGEHDYVRPVLGQLGVKEVFWRVSQKPGKPIYFGTRGKRVVFGLPGNPASGFVCFYVYVYPALRHMSGMANPALPSVDTPIEEATGGDSVRWSLMKACRTGGDFALVRKLPRQGSHMVTSLVDTNSLIVLPAGEGTVEAGEPVRTVLLPHGREDRE